MSRPAILHLTNGKQMDISSDHADAIIATIEAHGGCVEVNRYEHGRWWRLTIPVTAIAYVEQAAPKGDVA